jgi:hypothetical protein
MRLTNFINLNELAYKGNIGFQELVQFYQNANDNEIDEMEKIINNSDWDKFRIMIKKVLGVNLK